MNENEEGLIQDAAKAQIIREGTAEAGGDYMARARRDMYACAVIQGLLASGYSTDTGELIGKVDEIVDAFLG